MQHGRIRHRPLASLSDSERAHLAPHLVRVPLKFKQLLYRQGQPADRVDFPESGVISLIFTVTDGRSVEVALVGNEGVVGINAVYHSPMCCEAVVQVAGEALVLQTEDIPRRGAAGRALADILNRHAHALLAHTIQTAGCNRLHFIRPRAARWILTMSDRAASPRFRLTFACDRGLSACVQMEPTGAGVRTHGTSKSAVSRRFVAKTAAQLDAWRPTSLDAFDLVELLIDDSWKLPSNEGLSCTKTPHRLSGAIA